MSADLRVIEGGGETPERDARDVALAVQLSELGPERFAAVTADVLLRFATEHESEGIVLEAVRVSQAVATYCQVVRLRPVPPRGGRARRRAV